ncbi:MAG TPA: recombinase RecT [Burkholderiales bacterium]|nr:recombinase RecT [Burkholderiales bacterium]
MATDTTAQKHAAEPQRGLSIVVNTVKEKQMQQALQSFLPPDMPLDKFTAATIEALKRRPDLFEDADRNSLYNAIADAARDGLIPDGKQGALVPFNIKQGDRYVKRVQWMLMPEGILAKLAKAGVTAYAVSVYANDEIVIWYDDKGQHVEHKPILWGERGERVGAYACARTKADTSYVEFMNMEDIERVMKASKQQKDGKFFGPWADWPERMEQKSVLHRICKRVPNVGIAEDEEYTDPNRTTITVAPTEPVRTERPRALQAVVDQTPVEQPQTPATPPAEPF